MNNEPFVIERTFNAPISRVWSAITDKNEMKQWYFDLPDFKAEVGHEFRFTGGPDGRSYVHICIVTEVVAPVKLAYSWRYEGYEGNSEVTFELSENAYGTTLKLTHAGLETFPASNPDLARHNFAAGWTEIVGNSLSNYLQKA